MAWHPSGLVCIMGFIRPMAIVLESIVCPSICQSIHLFTFACFPAVILNTSHVYLVWSFVKQNAVDSGLAMTILVPPLLWNFRILCPVLIGSWVIFTSLSNRHLVKSLLHNIPNCMKEVTWLSYGLCTNGHRSAALGWLPFILPPVFVHAVVIRSW